MPRHSAPAWLGTFFRSLVALAAVACSDGTGPGRPSLPGTRVLAVRDYAAWTWAPSSQEIVFSTPFDAPYTGPPTRLEAVAVPSGARRTVVAAPSNGDHIIGYRFTVVGAHVYYEVADASYDQKAFYRAPLDGSSPPEKLADAVDPAPAGVSAAPNERAVAWVEQGGAGAQWSLVVVDIASGARRTYSLAQPADRITWSPTGRSVVLEPNGGTLLQWIDLSTGTTRVWLEPAPGIDLQPTRDIGWDGESPFDYIVGADVARYSLATGARELLATLDAPGHAIGWSPDFTTVTVQTDVCQKWSGGPFGSSCIDWSIRVDRIRWKSNLRTTILRYKGYGDIFARAAPDGSWLAYEYRECSDACAGVYILRT